MSTRAIVPVKLSLTEGDFYTLWAPKWRQSGSEWQAFLGDDEAVLAFNSPAELLCFVESGTKHDLLDHPQWEQFSARPAHRVTPAKRDEYDLIGMPEALAGRPSHANVSTVARDLEVASALADVAAAEQTTIFFATHVLAGFSSLLGAPLAQRIGLVVRVFPHDTMLDEVFKIADKIAAAPFLSVRHAKALVRRYWDHNKSAEGAQAELDAVMEITRTADCREGIRAFLDKRQASYRGPGYGDLGPGR